MPNELTWDDTYAIARALITTHPDTNINEVSLVQIFEWTLQLPDFHDDPQLINDAILMAIFREWFEEVNTL
jgi:FeS assembly protein IscX